MMTNEYELHAQETKRPKRGRHRGETMSLLQDLRAAIVARIATAEDNIGPRRARRHA